MGAAPPKMGHMAAARDPLPDPIDGEADRFFAESEVRAAIEKQMARSERGELDEGHSTDEVRRRLGLPSPDE
jgi:hypothetical protein